MSYLKDSDSRVLPEVMHLVQLADLTEEAADRLLESQLDHKDMPMSSPQTAVAPRRHDAKPTPTREACLAGAGRCASQRGRHLGSRCRGEGT